ncbi:hypothetical protein [Rhodoligotrophos ferricapiens]|uniref:hypothetical protein n=1 Tax=Rhodoligotrophos ferricapiens TaxID=3069264 RepID=UPI00315D04FC
MIRLMLAAGLLSAACLTPALAQNPGGKAGGAQPAHPHHAAMDAQSKENLEALKPLDCTVQRVVICDHKGECSKSETFGEMPLPAKMLADPLRRILAGVSKDGLPHLSAIHLYGQNENDLTAQGMDGEVSWMLVADRKDDTMTFSASSDNKIMTGFGICKDIDEQ